MYERIDGPTMDDRARTHPWEIVALGRRLGALHARMHEADGSGFPDQRPALHDAIERAAAELTPEQAAAGHTRIDSLPTASRLCHGDLHPGNVMLGEKPIVIDWENVRSGSPAADVARSIYLIRDAAMAGLPAPVAMIVGALRAVVARAYLAGYSSVGALDMAAVDAWRLAILATRLAEGIAAERAALTAEIERSLMAAGTRLG